MNSAEKLRLLRRRMQEQGMDAYVVVTDDFHGSEYVGDYFKAREYLSGFTGSAGTLVVLPDSAALWTDGRYFLQAADQLAGSTIDLMRAGQPGVPTIGAFLAQRVPQGGTVGFDGRTVSSLFARTMAAALEGKNVRFAYEQDLAGAVWPDRPALSAQPVWELPAECAGLTREEKLHLLLGLKRILLDIDKAIAIIRETEEEAEVIPNLMIGFGIDQIQAEYVAEIKLRNINKEYILKRVQETESLQGEIQDLEDTLQKPARIRRIMVEELTQVRKKYAQPRKTEIIYSHEVEEYREEEQVEDYPVTVFLSREGYFKKITPQSLRMSGEQKYKEGDGPSQQAEATNAAEVMFFTDRCQVYKTRLSEFGDSKASVLGDYLPAKLGMDESESVVYMVLPGDYSGHLLFFFENGKIARVEMKAYATVSNRRKLTGAYSDKSRLVAILPLAEDRELALLSTEPRALIFHTSLLLPKATRSTQGVAVMTLKPKYQLQRVCTPEESGIVNLPRYRARSIPGTGALLRPEDRGEEQLTLL